MSQNRTGLFILACVTIGATFLLLLIGGTVNPTGSSLACPDWPNCFGTFYPEMTGGVFFEHSHRLMATLVGALTTILCVWVLVASPAVTRAIRFLTLGALFMVIVQGVLGGLTVLYQLPTMVSVAHFGLSIIFFLTLVLIAFKLWQGDRVSVRDRKKDVAYASARRWLIAGTHFVFLQMLIGALVRHMNAGRICGLDPFLCQGALMPTHGLGHLHMFHRFLAYAVALFIVVMCVRVTPYVRTIGSNGVRALLLSLPWLVVLQVMLGFLTVMSNIGVWQVVAHLAGAVLLLTGCVLVLLRIGHGHQDRLEESKV